MFTDSAANMEIASRSGLDWLLVDLEHGFTTETTLVPMLLAAKGSGVTSLVRVESGTRIRVGRALDLGAQGVMVPQVHSADDADAVVRWMRTQPAGERGIAMFTRGMGYGSVGHGGVSTRHEDLVGIIQIESQGALDDLDLIAATEGVDVLFVGPTDLTHALGVPGQIDQPVYQEAISRVATAARANGKAAGVLLWKPEDVAAYAALGFTFFGLSSEAMILDRAIRSALDAVKSGVEAAS
jgi:4-hydroxy-2-oxoheptanedioate aldolase